jgi:hypothetical protein
MRKILSLIILFALVLSINLIAATELKLVKVSELKPGDIIVDKNGNEIAVNSIVQKSQNSKTISELVNEKVYGTDENKTGSITGFVISSNEKLNQAQPKIIEKIKTFFSGWFK